MSAAQNIVNVVQQAVQDYNSTDNSNTLLILRDMRPTVQPYSVMTKTCFVEFDPMNSRAKLPACLTRDIGSSISNYVILEDPYKNQIQVSIEKKNAKIYFTRGWTRLRHFYRLGCGGWVTLLYMSPTLFHIKVWKITGIEITYPQKSPPHKLMLREQSNECFPNGPVPYFVSPGRFVHTLEKTLDSTDVESGVLKLSWNGFCEIALPNEDTELTIVDWFGYTWKCPFEVEGRPHKACRIAGEWRSICKARRLVEGVTLRLGATKPSNNNVVHLKIHPFIGVRTTLIAPTTSGRQKAFYQAEHYFML